MLLFQVRIRSARRSRFKDRDSGTNNTWAKASLLKENIEVITF